MTDTALAPLGMVLEHARQVLEGRPDVEGANLRHDVNNVLAVVRLLEVDPGGESWRDQAAEIAVRGRALVERVRAYADEHRLRFLQCDTPCPERSDTIVMSLAEIRERMAGADAPPIEVLEVLIDAQMPEAHHAIPPAAPTGDFSRFADDDDNEE